MKDPQSGDESDAGLATPDPPRTSSSSPARRRRGRPVEMVPVAVLDAIRRLARRRDGLFRVHRTHAALYSRARRQFGSWLEAVRAAGLDYAGAILEARSRSVRSRRRRRRSD